MIVIMNITDEDNQLIAAAREALERAYDPIWHTVGGAVRTRDGRVFSGVNVDASTGSGGGACAEMAALSAAIAAGEKHNITTIVAAMKDRILPPCGICRQTLITHVPEVSVIIQKNGDSLERVRVRDLLPYAYENTRDAGGNYGEA